MGQGGSRDRDKTRRALEDASRTLRREVQFICVFDSKCHEMKQLRMQIFKNLSGGHTPDLAGCKQSAPVSVSPLKVPRSTPDL